MVGPFGEVFFRKEAHNAEKLNGVDALVLPGNVCYAEKRKIFLVQFPGQQV